MAAPKVEQKEEPVQKYGDGKVTRPNAILLWSSLSSNSHQTAAQKRMSDKLKAHKVRIEQLDGSQPENKDARSKLFNCSDVRGKYPQIFIVNEKDELKYIGMDDEIDFLIDSEKFDELFASCIAK
mmetsp:Transcript_25101/g.40744  ORF Transcript_25101/g.40744 Transcript_25101/m.40744 type:complete len:125 (+) Transcript_25101:60-434(+)|eukprot:CAMPEP_0202703900 /NCGR_PEP_ID=MMETSP1385-20130828/16686_2 /ASSEMBLY_ACC=CAM_ASM_000861 /TAXON_ID=933848 /ORGANISM="Elphidium margaritaceum" /LENGTH=124 /DNA_ID=CAMNT_0049361821 /DNA_START=52 /DNA_END=426 /DNA_ORIENTATION=-